MTQIQSSSSAPIAVTGSTGRLGGLVARFLSDAGVSQRLLVRSPERAPQLAGAEIVRFTYFDTEETRSALKGIETLFMVSAAESADRLEQHRQFIQAAAASGVKNIVYTSFLGASEDATFTLARDHGKTEDFIRANGMNFTFLRDNFYQDVFPLFATDGVIAGPAEDGKVAAVAIEDVARVATEVLQAPEKFRNEALDLTGPESLDLNQIAEKISQVTGEKTVYRAETLEEARQSRAVYEPEEWQMQAWISTYTAIASGALATPTDTVQNVLRRAPQTLEETLKKAQKN